MHYLRSFPAGAPLSGALLLAPFLFLLACGRSEEPQAMDPSLEAYVVGYTQGSVSRMDPLRLQLQQPPDPAPEAGAAAPSHLLRLRPAVRGTLVWEDPQTLLFTPDAPLASGQTYRVEADLASLFPELPGGAGAFSYQIFTYDQFLNLDTEGLQRDPEGPATAQLLTATAYTSDYLDPEAMEAGFRAEQEGRELAIRWTHSADGRTHRLEVGGIERRPDPSAMTLRWDGPALGLRQGGEERVPVPALGVFKIAGVDVGYNPDPFFVLRFTEALDPRQDLAGLFRLADGAMEARYERQGQVLRIYPTGRLSGTVTLRFEAGIRDAAGKNLGEALVWTVAVQGLQPAVRAVGEGILLPSSEGLLFPFEALGLHAIELEVFKVFGNNILQLLQNQTMEETRGNLRAVGRVVYRGRIDLGGVATQGSRGEWTRYAIDLHRWMDTDPGAIYQVRIGFRPEYTDYACDRPPASLPADPTVLETELSNWWYGPYGYYSDYRYDQREDPCYPAYYNSDRFLQRNLLATNLGLLVKGSTDGNYLAVASDLRSTAPLVDATVTYYDYQRQIIASASTDSRGVAQAKLEREPYVAVAEHGRDRAWLRLQGGDALSTSAFSVEGRRVQEGRKGFLYAERGVWRPGDSIFLHLILEDEQGELPPNYPVTLELYDPRDQLITRRVSSARTGPIYPLFLRTPADALTGTWRVQVRVGGASFYKALPIEAVQPNRLEIDLELPPAPLLRSRQPYRAGLQVNWLQGAPGANLRFDVELGLREGPATRDEYPGFLFSDVTRSLDRPRRRLHEGRTDARGAASLPFSVLGEGAAPGPLEANFYIRAFEPGGNFSSGQESIVFHPYDTYVGLRVPANDYGWRELPLDEETGIAVRALGWDGAAAPNLTLRASLYRLDWRWWWESGLGNVSRFNASDSRYLVGEPATLTTDATGAARWPVQLEQWGRYLLRVCDPQGGHCASTLVYAGSPRDGGGDLEREAAAMLVVRADQEVYQPGETITLDIPDSQQGKMLISIEDGSRILRHFWARADSLGSTFSFEATPDMAPNAYAHVTIIQPHGQRANDLPIRLYGIQSLAVEDPATRLQPQLQLPGQLAPRADFEVLVGEATGRPMNYTLAIVDEGLLALTNFPSPDPHAALYAREALGVQTWDLYDQVLGPFGGTGQRILATGGDGGELQAPEDERFNRFEPVVLRAGPFHLPAGQTARHRFTMPNYVGRVRTMLVAADETGAYGSAEAATPVQQDLMVLATLPRVLSPGESCALPVNVFAMAPAIRNARVEVEASPGLIRWPAGTRQDLTFADAGNQVAYFPFTVGSGEGVAEFRIGGQSGNTRASQEVSVQVRNPNPLQTNTLSEVLEAGQSWSPAIALPGTVDSRKLTLELSRLPPLNLVERLDYLIDYPYGCMEQIVSAAFAQLFLPRLLELTPAQQESVNRNVRAAIERLSGFQLPSGGFSYWPGGNGANLWGSSYAGHFLLEARDQGYALPPGMVDRWHGFQQEQARAWNPRPGLDDQASHDLDQAYRLYSMAAAQLPDLAAMNRLREYAGLRPAARWQLAAAYGRVGRREVAERLVADAPATFADYRQPGPTFGSSTRDRALIMETLLLLDRSQEAARLLEELALAMQSRRWLSTQTTAFVLQAAYRFVGDEPANSPMSFRLNAAGRDPLRGGSSAPALQVELPVATGGEEARIELRNEGSGKLFARLVAQGKPLSGPVAARADNLQLGLRYLGLDGEALDPSQLIQGTDFVVEARVRHPGRLPLTYEHLALEQVFPSGWEILPYTRQEDSPDEANASYTYRDIRDDRVRTFFDLRPGEERVFRIRLNAAYLGRFYLPPSACGAMYDNRVQASTASGWIEVVRPPS